MAILTTEAVVLKGWKMGETSQILSLYTEDFGRVKVVVKGGRGPKSAFKGCLEPLTHLKIIYYDKRTRDLQLLSKADLLDPHLNILGNMEKTTLGLAVLELVDRAVAGQESFPQLFHLIISVLKSINLETGFLEGFFWYFESHFIDLMGYKPKWESCLECHESLGTSGGYFQPQSGGLLCNGCGSAHGGLVVQGETLEILFWLQKCQQEEVGNLNPSAGQKAEIRKMFDLYFRTHIDPMKSLNSLKLFYELAS
jgi:DNA repair protein RecO (recombination protein O)